MSATHLECLHDAAAGLLMPVGSGDALQLCAPSRCRVYQVRVARHLLHKGFIALDGSSVILTDRGRRALRKRLESWLNAPPLSWRPDNGSHQDRTRRVSRPA